MSLMNACSKPVIQIQNLFSPFFILVVDISENSLNSSSISTILARKRPFLWRSKKSGLVKTDKKTSKLHGHLNKSYFVIWLKYRRYGTKPKAINIQWKNVKIGRKLSPVYSHFSYLLIYWKHSDFYKIVYFYVYWKGTCNLSLNARSIVKWKCVVTPFEKCFFLFFDFGPIRVPH